MSRTIGTILTLKDKMSPKLIKVSSNVKNMSKDMQRASKQAANMANKFASSVNKMVGKAAKLAAAVASAAVVTGGAALIKQSDAYAGIQARLRLINDGQQTVDEFNQKIFESADRARGNYQDMADIIGKLGITAGDAFKSNDEILQFSELMSKSFKVGGASAQEQSAAMYQLTQAMASGKLQGDEFRSIAENAPMLAQAIANEMGVSMGQLKEMSSEGKITSDVIKSALFNSADIINKQFAEMPLTFAEATTKIKNTLTQKLEPAFKKLSDWLNSDEGKAAIDKVGDAIARVAEKIPPIIDSIIGFVKSVYDGAKKLFEFIKKHQDIIIFIGTFVVAIAALIKIMAALKTAFAVVQVAMMLFNGTLMISPIGWIIGAIALLVAAGVLLYKNWDKVKAKAIEVWNAIKEKVRAAVQPIVDAWNRIKSAGKEAWEAIKNTFDNFKRRIEEAFTSFINGIKQKWEDLKAFLKNPLKGTVNLISSSDSPRRADSWGGKALGTHYWRGGVTRINERGGEIVDLPNGSRVIPADKSEKLMRGGGNNVTIHINAVNKSTNEIMSELVPRLKLVLANI